MYPHAIIFDMDGTIVNTEKIWAQATELLLTKHLLKTISAEERDSLYQYIHGLATHEACKLIKEISATPHTVSELAQEKQKIALELYRKGINFIEGFSDFHAKLTQVGIKNGVATNADELILRTTDELVDLKKFFGQHLYSINNVSRGKPHPDIYLHVAEKLGINPQMCVAIEDSAHGISAAKAAGMVCIGINTSRNPHQLKKADLVIDTYHDIELAKLWDYL